MKVLVVDDDPTMVSALSEFLSSWDYEVGIATTGAGARNSILQNPPDIVLLDVQLPDIGGLELVSQFRAGDNPPAVVMMTGAAEVHDAVRAMKAGAEDYLTKPLEFEELEHLLARISEKLRLKQEVSALKHQLREQYQKDYVFLPDAAMQHVYEKISQVAKHDAVTALILGETGTGKEHAARLIHLYSPRSAAPFVEMHCGAFPETLLESELFGYEAGAFTDARKQKKGLFEVAQGGTIFLDEVGELPPTIQTKLLKVLEQKTLRRLGGLHEIKLNVKIVAATNRDLEQEVQQGRFRADLFYRLNMFPIVIPPLRTRPKDVVTLSQFFFESACQSFEQHLEPLSEQVLKALMSYHWPGNVRELKNAIYRVVIGARSRVEKSDLAEVISAHAAVTSTTADLPSSGTLAISEREEITKTLRLVKGNKTQAAKELGISRNTLLSKLRKYEIE